MRILIQLLYHFVMLVILAVCSLPNTTKVYSKTQLMQCLEVPVLTQEQFDDNQLTTKRIMDLYAYTEQAKHLNNAQQGKLDIMAELEQIDAKSADYVGQPAYRYFSDIQALFLRLNDAHTYLRLPSVFQGFQEWLPFCFECRKDGKWYLMQIPEYVGYIYSSALEQEYVQDLSAVFGKEVTSINGMAPLEYMTQMSKLHTHVSRSEHGNVNWYASQQHFINELELDNIINEDGAQIEFEIDSRKYTSSYVYATTTPYKSDDDMLAAYRNSFEQPAASGKSALQPRSRRRLVRNRGVSLRGKADYSVLYTADGFLYLMKRKDDYILTILTFQPENYDLAFEQLIQLHTELSKIDFTKSNLFIELAGNSGGYGYLSHLTAFIFSPNEFPIIARGRTRRTETLDRLFKANISLYNEQWSDWVTGQQVSQETHYFGSRYANQSEIFSLNAEFEVGVSDAAKRIYALEPLKLQPNRTFLVSDGSCFSACADFAIKLKQLGIAQLIALGGTGNEAQVFTTVEGPGSAALTSEILAEQIGTTADAYLNSLKYKHDAILGFMYISLHSFFANAPESQLQEPYEFVVFKPDYIIKNAHYNWALDAYQLIDLWIDQAAEFAASAQNTGFGQVCKTVDNVEYRYISDNCSKFSCSFGYMRSGADFACVPRTDYWKDLIRPNPDRNLPLGWIFGGILLGVVVVAAIITTAVCCVKKRKAANQPKIEQQRASQQQTA